MAISGLEAVEACLDPALDIAEEPMAGDTIDETNPGGRCGEGATTGAEGRIAERAGMGATRGVVTEVTDGVGGALAAAAAAA